VVRDAINCRGKVEDWACSDDDSSSGSVGEVEGHSLSDRT